MTGTNDERLRQMLIGAGASKLIYSLVMPETEAVKRKVMGGGQQAEFEQTLRAAGARVDSNSLVEASKRASAPYFASFREAWTQKQDAMHHVFFDRWLEWARPIASVSKDDFPFRYPTAGASEGLRALIDEYGARARRDRFEPQIHVFDGDYEGFAAYAQAAYIPVAKHDRGGWQHAVAEVARSSANRPVQWYISQPSSIDGNVWAEFDAFMRQLADAAPRAEVVVDLTYVGCIFREARIATDYPNIPAIVMSLSKPMGAYYDRIGGVLARPRRGQDEGPYPALFGNMWFKNLTSLAIGMEFMTAHGVAAMPAKYRSVQERAIDAVNANLQARRCKLALEPSDVFLLATGEMPADPDELHRYLERAGDGRKIIRVCLTPAMAAMIGMAEPNNTARRP
jgi:histidinol-phosphate/aromatic aminotransferase/cobyric acid decarboxylase-like protein